MPYKNPDDQRKYSKSHYSKNKQSYLESNNRRRKELKKLIRDIKESMPCADCRINYPHYIMDFDHLKDKEGLIRLFVHDNNRKGLLSEVKKCEVVCSNCHRRRTHSRLLLEKD